MVQFMKLRSQFQLSVRSRARSRAFGYIAAEGHTEGHTSLPPQRSVSKYDRSRILSLGRLPCHRIRTISQLRKGPRPTTAPLSVYKPIETASGSQAKRTLDRIGQGYNAEGLHGLPIRFDSSRGH